MRYRGVIFVVWCLALLLLAAGEVMACPNCKEALPSADAGSGNVAEGFYYSILLMMAAPFLLAAGFGTTIWYYARKGGPSDM